MNLFVERIERRAPHGQGYAEEEQRLREALGRGREILIEAGKRDEVAVEPGQRAVVYVMEGSVRFEGDDTPAAAGDEVWFRPSGERGLVGIEADSRFRGVLVTEAPRERG